MIVIAGIVAALLGLGRYLRHRKSSSAQPAEPADQDSSSVQPTGQDRSAQPQ
jgi:hypothetical protein